MKTCISGAATVALSLAFSILLTPAVLGQDAAGTQNRDGSEALRLLQEKLKRASRDWRDSYDNAKTDALRRTLNRNNAYRLFEKRFLALAQKFRNDPAAFEALKWLVNYANPGSVFDGGLSELQNHYLEHEQLESLCQTLVQRRSAGIEAFLLHVAENHSEQSVRATALLSLARQLKSRADAARRRLENEQQWLEYASNFYQRDTIAWIQKDDPSELSKRAEGLLTRVVQDYSEFPDNVYKDETGRDRTIGDAANAFWFSLAPVGRAAPALVGRDTNGDEVSLKELRGRTVLLMFCADWCLPCKESYGQLRELTEIYEQKAFSVITVMADKYPATAARAIKSGEISWPVVWDGPGGPIASAWNVTSYPSVYLIDSEGLIASHGLRDDALDDEIASMLGVVPGERVKRDKRSRVWRLSFRDKKIDGEDLATVLDGYTELRELDFGGNQVADQKLMHLRALKKLRTLKLAHTGITDDGLEILQGITSLREVMLYLGPEHKTTKGGRRALRDAVPGLRISFITH